MDLRYRPPGFGGSWIIPIGSLVRRVIEMIYCAKRHNIEWTPREVYLISLHGCFFRGNDGAVNLRKRENGGGDGIGKDCTKPITCRKVDGGSAYPGINRATLRQNQDLTRFTDEGWKDMR